MLNKPDWKFQIIENKIQQIKNHHSSLMNNFNNRKKLTIIATAFFHISNWLYQNKLTSIEISLDDILSKVDARQLKTYLMPFMSDINKITPTREITVRRFDRPKEAKRLAYHSYELVVLCQNIKSANNLGNIVRTAECLGFKKVITTGITPDITADKVGKSSMGSELYIEWQYYEDHSQAITDLQKNGYTLISLETVNKSTCISEIKSNLGNKTCLILGNENTGIDDETLQKSDYILNLPQFGRKNSLNVTNAFAAAGYLLFT